MANEKYNDMSEFTSSKNWNTAEAYTNLQIQRHINNCDELRTICESGTLDINSQIIGGIPPQKIVEARVIALRRYFLEIKHLIDNCMFALNKKDKDEAIKIEEKVRPLQAYLDNVTERKGGVVVIKRKLYDELLGLFNKYLRDLKTPINNSNIIYGSNIDFDPVDFKQKIKDNIINVG